MNVTLIRALLLQRFTSPMRLAVTSLFTFFPFVGVALSGDLSVLGGIAGPLAVVFAAGAIGQDVSAGTLQLLLVRPVTRPSYVVHRWLGAVIAALLVTLATILCSVLVLVLRGTPATALQVVRLVLESTTTIAGHAAVVVMFSSLLSGVADVGLLVGLLFVAQMAAAVAAWKQWPVLARAATEFQATLTPTLSWAWLGQGVAPSWFNVASWASSLTLALAIAITVMNRRELSYATD